MNRQEIMSLGLDSFLTTAQVAKILNVSPGILRTWRKSEKVGPPYMKFGRGSIRYQKSDVDDFIEQSKR